ncbi:MAG: hypothetical protein ABSB32_22795, partial [Thermodesulfobacteriota bacterium]
RGGWLFKDSSVKLIEQPAEKEKQIPAVNSTPIGPRQSLFIGGNFDKVSASITVVFFTPAHPKFFIDSLCIIYLFI